MSETLTIYKNLVPTVSPAPTGDYAIAMQAAWIAIADVLDLLRNNQNANTFLRGPNSGAAAGVSWGPLVDGDLSGVHLSALAAAAADLSIGSHKLTNVANAVSPQDATTLTQVQSLISSAVTGLDWKNAVFVAVGTNVNIATPGTNPTLDGQTITDGVRVLLYGQSTASQNGIYVYNNPGGPAPTFTRATDAASSVQVTSGMACGVTAGSKMGQVGILTTNDPITLDTTALTFTFISAAVSAGAGINITGSVVSVATGGVTNAMLAGSITASNLVGTDIATVGTITAGTWHATVIGTQYGGTGANLSATGGASQVLKQTSTGAAITVGQLAFTDISGSVAASQLPNPSATTLGGIESFAAQTSKWINAISTSGVPSATQPGFSDLAAPTGSVSFGSQRLTTLADPISAQDAATKNYVDATVQGLQVKPTARLATTAALATNTYSNGTSGVGATLTATANGALSIDSQTVAVNDLILVKNEATAANNGLYTVTQAGDASHPYILTRHVDMDQAAEFSGALIPVGNAGTTNANSLWLANPSGAVTVGTTSIPFTQLNGATDLIQGSGISISGNTISVATGGVTNAMLAGSIAASKLVGSDIATVGTITTGVWNGTKIGLAYGGTNVDLSATGGASQVLKQTSVGGNITVAQLAFSDISGTATAGQIPNLDASKITTGQLAVARGGTAADLSATGGTSQVLKQTTSGGAITVGQLAFSDISGTATSGQIPALDASKITTGQLALARGGTNADLSATGGASQVLKQVSAGAAITVGQLTFNDLAAPSSSVAFGSQRLTNLADPSSAQDAATKNYVDATVQGLQVKPTARLATTGALAANTYSNGTSGVGATLTATGNGALFVDSVSVSVGDLILVKNEATAANNGLYTVTQAGDASHPYILTRHADMDQAAEFSGALIPVGNAGTVNANSLWLANPSGAVTVGTTSIPFTQLNGATDLIQGSGISISGNTISVATGGVTNAMLAGSIAASKLVGTDIATVGTITAGTWNATKIGLAYGGTNADLSATGGAHQVLQQASSGGAITVGQLAFSDISGTLSIGAGGTGQTSANAALNAFLPTQTGHGGQFLTTDGSNTSWATAGGGGSSSPATVLTYLSFR